MTLKEYLKEQDLSAAQAAKALNISRQHMTSIISGSSCGKRLAKEIELFTNGVVPRESILYPDEYASRRENSGG